MLVERVDPPLPNAPLRPNELELVPTDPPPMDRVPPPKVPPPPNDLEPPRLPPPNPPPPPKDLIPPPPNEPRRWASTGTISEKASTSVKTQASRREIMPLFIGFLR